MSIFKFKKNQIFKGDIFQIKKYPMYLFLIYRYVICSNFNEDVITPLLELSRNLHNEKENVKELTIKKFKKLEEALEKTKKMESLHLMRNYSDYFDNVLKYKDINIRKIYEDFLEILREEYKKSDESNDIISAQDKFNEKLKEFFNDRNFMFNNKIKKRFTLKVKEILEEIERKYHL
ncbi:hypothetical protein H311_00320 [Anncaliia algerae PRA109]|nr:hypothetical protein H311_00320 [Anncaliia algerae PRA109]